MGINYLANLALYIPELIAIVTMMGLLFLEATYKQDEKAHKYVFIGSLIGMVVCLVSLILNMQIAATPAFTNAVMIDPFSTMVKIIMTLGTIGAIYIGHSSKDVYQGLKSEFYILVIGALVGGMLLASANNMLTLYLGVETLSIISYVLASFKKNDDRSAESGLKYVLYGGISAGIMLFGMSHIYGVLGTIQFTGVLPKLASLSSMEIAILMPAFLLFFAGLGYKIACVPFHMWSPDVYEGAPLPVTAFFAIVPKLAGMAALVRVSMVFFSNEGMLQYGWLGTLQVVAALTMIVGNVAAINQRSVKRMLAYSSIGHAGVMLLGVVVVDAIGARAILFYGVTYLFMTLGAFYITSFVSDKYDNDHFDRFSGLLKRYPLMSIMMCIVMFSLAGVPPLAGFVAKFNILTAAINKQFYTLAVIAGVTSVISLYYYLKIVRLMVFKEAESDEKIEGFGFLNQLIIIGVTVPVVFLGIFWEKLMIIVNGASILTQ